MSTLVAMNPDDVATAILRAFRPTFKLQGQITLGYFVEFSSRRAAIYWNPFDGSFHKYRFDATSGYAAYVSRVPSKPHWLQKFSEAA